MFRASGFGRRCELEVGRCACEILNLCGGCCCGAAGLRSMNLLLTVFISAALFLR